MMDIELFYLVINFLIFLIFFFTYFRKVKKNLVGVLIFGVVFISSLMSIVFYLQPYSTYLIPNYLPFWPLLYWLILFIITMAPIFQFDHSNIITIQYKYSPLKYIAIFSFAVSIIPFCEQLIILPSLLGKNDFQTLHDEASVEYLSGLSRFLLNCNTFFHELLYVILIVVFVQEKLDKKLIFFLVFAIVTRTLLSVMLGHRGPIMELLLKFVLVYFIAKPLLPKSRNQIIVKYGIIVLGIFLAIFIIISISRLLFWSDVHLEFTAIFFFSRYMGEGFVNFDQYMPVLKCNTDGDLTLGYFTNLLWGNDYFVDGQFDWYSLAFKQGVRPKVFYTYIGNFVQDFGFVGTFLIWSFVSFVFFQLTKSRNGIIPLSSIYLLVFYSTILLYGITSFKYHGIHSKYLLLNAFIYCYLRFKKM